MKKIKKKKKSSDFLRQRYEVDSPLADVKFVDGKHIQHYTLWIVNILLLGVSVHVYLLEDRKIKCKFSWGTEIHSIHFESLPKLSPSITESLREQIYIDQLCGALAYGIALSEIGFAICWIRYPTDRSILSRTLSNIKRLSIYKGSTIFRRALFS